jgi:hypothetical protein
MAYLTFSFEGFVSSNRTIIFPLYILSLGRLRLGKARQRCLRRLERFKIVEPSQEVLVIIVF